jgi:hypothetical protein
MNNETFLNEIRLRRDLHSVIKHTAMIAARLFALEAQVDKIREHLGVDTDGEKQTQKEAI